MLFNHVCCGICGDYLKGAILVHRLFPVLTSTAYLTVIAAGIAQQAHAAEPLPVELVPVITSEIGVEVRLTGTLEAVDSVDLGFREGGRVTDMLVREGDHFRQGDVLARIDPLQFQQALNVAEASLAAAVATQEQAQQAADRAQAMLDRGVGTRAARDTARQMLSAAHTQTEQAETSLDQARRSLEDTELVAPFDGVVTMRSGEAGQVVGPAQAVLSLASMSGLEAVFLTPDMAHLKDAMGAAAALDMIDVEAPPMMARVTEISPLIDAQTGSVRLRARVEDAPDDVSLLGAMVRGRIVLSVGEAVEIPWTALTSGEGGPAVWVLDEAKRAELRHVEIERFDDGKVFLSGGVEPGEVVVAAGSQMLFPGREVVDVESGL
ncbi:efflux RND transporter periplasmic adaptor subunit [Paracoccus aerodenitrificans]|uniref:efflux RND transporter periplasmic adaptor subunit n=1 Tax=Paracoccus aerodenitrificans TaxID=3017781 RepID=UPI003EC12986